METNDVENVGNSGLYHRLRIAASGLLLLSLFIAVIALASLASNQNSSEVRLSSSQRSSLQTLDVTNHVALKSGKDLKLGRSKKALTSLEVLAVSRKTVTICIDTFYDRGLISSS